MRYYAIATYHPEGDELFEFDTLKELKKAIKENPAIIYAFYGSRLKTTNELQKERFLKLEADENCKFDSEM